MPNPLIKAVQLAQEFVDNIEYFLLGNTSLRISGNPQLLFGSHPDFGRHLPEGCKLKPNEVDVVKRGSSL
jgi:hypothetical protein